MTSVLVALSDARRRFPLPHQSFLDLIDGVRMDVEGASYERFEDLVVYCRRVAGSIGRLCVAVYGSDDDRAGDLADDLGVALQLTNILRDVREDAERGRTYLPAEDLARFGEPGPATIDGAGGLRGRPRTRVVRAGPDADRTARPPQRGVRARDERYLQTAARPYRVRSPGDPAAARLPLDSDQDRGGRTQPARSRYMNVVVVGGGVAGIVAALDCAAGRRRGHAR